MAMMRSHRRRNREVEIFNFSFLDVLACTIGLLIFVMVMIFVLQTGRDQIVDNKTLIQERVAEAKTARERAAEDDRIARTLENQVAGLSPSVKPELVKRRTEAQGNYESKAKERDDVRAALAALEEESSRLRSQNADASTSLAAAKARWEKEKKELDARLATGDNRFMPKAQGEGDIENYDILHVDCQANTFALLRADKDGKLEKLGVADTDTAALPNELLQREIAAQKKKARPLVMLWVRPDGKRTYESVRLAIDSGIPLGYEPLDSKWQFDAK